MVAGQKPHWARWAFYSGMCMGLGSDASFMSSRVSSGYKIPPPSSWSRRGWVRLVIWTSPIIVMKPDENYKAFKDPLHVPVRPITKVRSKKIKEALNGLIQEIWADSNAGHSKLGPKEDEGVINLIQAIKGWFALIGCNLWRGLMADWLSSPILVNSHFSYSGTYYFRPDLP